MKKLFSLLLVISLAMVLTACGGTSTTSDANEDTSALEGLWVYEAPADQDPSYVVNLTIDPENAFTLEINNNITADAQATTNTSNITGTYTAEEEKLTLHVDSVEDTGILKDVKEGSDLELTYQLSADNDVITLNDLSNYVTDMPSSIELQKGNQ